MGKTLGVIWVALWLTQPALAAVSEAPLQPLMRALSTASSKAAAAPLEQRVEILFLNSGSPSVNLLMSRSARLLAIGKLDPARALLRAVTEIAPDYAEGWHQRARLAALKGDDRTAILFLERTIILNPRQFEAYAELGSLLRAYGDDKGALAMYRKAAALDPYYDDVRSALRALVRKVEGQSI